MYCKNCGKEIDDNASICVYCGVMTGKTEEVQKKVNAFGIAGFVVSLASLYLGAYFCVASVVGLVLSIVGMIKSKECRLNGLAIAGMVVGIISLAIWGLVWLIVGAAILSL